MVFGWGKKKTEPVPEDFPTSKEIKLADVQKINQDLLDLRASQTLAQIKDMRNQTLPLIKELSNIANTLEKDNLKVEDIDRHLRIIVVRGKKQVIDVIKKESGDLPKVSSIEDVDNVNNILNQKLKKIGDVLGRQTRVIHIFAKKYASKLKEILSEMKSTNEEMKKLITNYQNTKSDSIAITNLLNKIKSSEENSILKSKQILDLEKKLKSLDSQIKAFEKSLEKIKSSKQYEEFGHTQQSLTHLDNEKNKIKNDIDVQFTKISRPLSRYEYVSSLDKEQKSLLSQLVNGPFDALSQKNKDSIIIILENVRKGILSGSISVKDVEKSLSHLTETEELIGEFIKKTDNIIEKREKIKKKLSGFDNMGLSSINRDLEKTLEQKNDTSLKISSLKKEIEENSQKIPKFVSEIETNLKRFSNTDYHVVMPN